MWWSISLRPRGPRGHVAPAGIGARPGGEGAEVVPVPPARRPADAQSLPRAGLLRALACYPRRYRPKPISIRRASMTAMPRGTSLPAAPVVAAPLATAASNTPKPSVLAGCPTSSARGGQRDADEASADEQQGARFGHGRRGSRIGIRGRTRTRGRFLRVQACRVGRTEALGRAWRQGQGDTGETEGESHERPLRMRSKDVEARRRRGPPCENWARTQASALRARGKPRPLFLRFVVPAATRSHAARAARPARQRSSVHCR